jgi:hypothetical protein
MKLRMRFFADNDFEVEYLNENNVESSNNVVCGMELETENTYIEDATLVAG